MIGTRPRRLGFLPQLQRRRRCIGRIYVRLRRQRAHAKAQRALRWKLRQAYRLQAEVMEVGLSLASNFSFAV